MKMWPFSLLALALPVAVLAQTIEVSPSSTQTTIDQLGSATTLTNSDLLIIEPGGKPPAKQVTLGTLVNYFILSLPQGGSTPPPTSSTPPPSINPNSFYVATNGSDANPGTVTQPFATIAKGQAAMRASGTNKNLYIRAGTYTPPTLTGAADNCNGFSSSTGVALTAADNGESISYYPPDGVNTAILDGGSSSPSTGLANLICVTGQNITINGIQGQNAVNSIVQLAGSNNTVTNSQMHDIHALQFQGVIIIGYTATGNTVSNNYIYHSPNNGIQVTSGCTGCGNVSNTKITNNFVENVCQGDSDCGPIYFEDLATTNAGRSTGIIVSNNYVREYDQQTAPECCNAKGIYLDAGVSNITITGNVITGMVGNQHTNLNAEYCLFIHGGNNVKFQNNICDIGSGGNVALVGIQTDLPIDTMLNNIYENNIIIGSGATGQGYLELAGGSVSPIKPTTTNNAYFNYNGASINNSWNVGGADLNPTYENPQFTCWSYKITAGSPVFNTPVSFPAQPAAWGTAGFWGPPGFTVPQTGVVPSSPHTC